MWQWWGDLLWWCYKDWPGDQREARSSSLKWCLGLFPISRDGRRDLCTTLHPKWVVGPQSMETGSADQWVQQALIYPNLTLIPFPTAQHRFFHVCTLGATYNWVISLATCSSLGCGKKETTWRKLTWWTGEPANCSRDQDGLQVTVKQLHPFTLWRGCSLWCCRSP